MRKSNVEPRSWKKPEVTRLGELKDASASNSGPQGGTKT